MGVGRLHRDRALDRPDSIPWARFKRAFAALVDRLPAPLVLLIFLVPFLIVEPLLVVATVAIAMGYVVTGAIAWIVLKLLASASSSRSSI